MKIIDQRIQPDEGTVTIGQTIKIGYYTQEIENTKDAGIAYMDPNEKEMCIRDSGKPIWLDVNVAEFKRHAKTRFTQDSFIESIDFDFLEMHVIEEDQVSGSDLAKKFGVSRQVIVQDIALLRATNKNILSTNKGYFLYNPGKGPQKPKRSFCVQHTTEQMQDELYTIVDLSLIHIQMCIRDRSCKRTL